MLAVHPELLTEGAAPPLGQAAIDAIPTLQLGHGRTGQYSLAIELTVLPFISSPVCVYEDCGVRLC